MGADDRVEGAVGGEVRGVRRQAEGVWSTGHRLAGGSRSAGRTSCCSLAAEGAEVERQGGLLPSGRVPQRGPRSAVEGAKGGGWNGQRSAGRRTIGKRWPEHGARTRRRRPERRPDRLLLPCRRGGRGAPFWTGVIEA
jgi:hypothetical protein